MICILSDIENREGMTLNKTLPGRNFCIDVAARLLAVLKVFESFCCWLKLDFTKFRRIFWFTKLVCDWGKFGSCWTCWLNWVLFEAVESGDDSTAETTLVRFGISKIIWDKTIMENVTFEALRIRLFCSISKLLERNSDVMLLRLLLWCSNKWNEWFDLSLGRLLARHEYWLDFSSSLLWSMEIDWWMVLMTRFLFILILYGLDFKAQTLRWCKWKYNSYKFVLWPAFLMMSIRARNSVNFRSPWCWHRESKNNCNNRRI